MEIKKLISSSDNSPHQSLPKRITPLEVKKGIYLDARKANYHSHSFNGAKDKQQNVDLQDLLGLTQIFYSKKIPLI